MLESGQVLHKRYRLKELLGHNAGRQTWLAEDLAAQQPGESVVVKLLAFGNQMQWDSLKLFEREAQVLRRLSHSQIPQYRDYFSLEEPPSAGVPLWFALVQEHIPGISLKEVLARGHRLSEGQVRGLALQVLDVLLYLHELSPPVLHRDIKPSNLILGNDGQIHVVDFGAVQDRAATEGATFTVVGTYGYVPPEQFGGRAVPASDLYALGATVIHLLTGTAPADLPQSNLRIQFADQVSVSPGFVRWIRTLTEPALEQRFSQAREAREALESGGRGAALDKIRQPGGSRVRLRRSASQLKINIPGRGLSFADTFPLLFSVAWLSLVPTFAAWTLVLFTAFWPIALLFTPLWLLIGPRMIASVLIPAFGRTHVCLDSDHFEIEWRLFGIWYRQLGQTVDIHNVCEDVIVPLGFINPDSGRTGAVRDNKIPFLEHEVVTIQAGVKRYSWGSGLSSVERTWLIQEMRNWLDLK